MLDGFSTYEMILLGFAVVGGALVALRLVLMFTGATVDDVAGIDGDIGDHGDIHDLADSDYSFSLLSLQTISAFFMMFGLVGLAISRTEGATFLMSILGGMAAGSASVYVIHYLMKSAMLLNQDGTLDISVAIGCVGSVYANIPAGGVGEVTVDVGGRRREFEARCDEGALNTGARIKVVAVEGSRLVVEAV